MAILALLEYFWGPLLPHCSPQCDPIIQPQRPQKNMLSASQTSDGLKGVATIYRHAIYGPPKFYYRSRCHQRKLRQNLEDMALRFDS